MSMQFPHCDARILHAPGQCRYCDMHPEWQELRKQWGIAFTGEDPKLRDKFAMELPCPADFNRGKTHQQWGGNVPRPIEERPFEVVSGNVEAVSVKADEIGEFVEKAKGAGTTEQQLDSLVEKAQHVAEDIQREVKKIASDPALRLNIGSVHGTKADDPRRTTTNGITPGFEDAPAPGPLSTSGQHKSYWVLTETERAKGFIRPVRRSYRHVGIAGPRHMLRDLTPVEQERYAKFDYIKFEPYDDPESPVTGRFWTQAQLDRVGKGCGAVTTMGPAIAETYARDPRFYGSTFCAGCGTHLPVGEAGEFVWVDATGETTNERVGT